MISKGKPGKPRQMKRTIVLDGAVSFAFEENLPKRLNKRAAKCRICDGWLFKGEGRSFLVFAELSIFLCRSCTDWVNGFKFRWRQFEKD